MYTWPNPAFPFRFYANFPNLRIFIIENIQHNYLWLKEFHNKFKKNDFFFVYIGWHLNKSSLILTNQIF